jgi:hypothetical protein
MRESYAFGVTGALRNARNEQHLFPMVQGLKRKVRWLTASRRLSAPDRNHSQ